MPDPTHHEPTAAPTRPTREQATQALLDATEAISAYINAGGADGCLDSANVIGIWSTDGRQARITQGDLRRIAEVRAALLAGEGTAQPDPALDALVSELREAVAAYEGKAVGGPDGWQDPHDAEQYLAGSVDRLLDEIDRLRDTTNRADASARRRGEDRDALRAMVDGCREIVAEHEGKVDGDRPIDDIAAVVGYPERGTAPQPGTVTATYTNWQNETAERHFIPVSLWWGVTEWHPRSGWHLDAFDVDRRAMRSFALSGFDRNVIPLAQRGTTPQPPAEAEQIATLRSWGWAPTLAGDTWMPPREPETERLCSKSFASQPEDHTTPVPDSEGWGSCNACGAVLNTQGQQVPQHYVRVVAADGAPQPETDER